MVEAKNPILVRMLERLFASMVNGPAMNCRPHASRQRIDFAHLSRLGSTAPGDALLALFSREGATKVAARIPAPAKAAAIEPSDDEDAADDQAPEDKAAKQVWSEQQSLITKLRVIVDDARTYEQDTGVHVLDIGFPLLSLPPGSFGGIAGLSTRRILAPIAFIPINLTVKTGTRQSVELACRGEGVDLVRPNLALLAWLEQQTGQSFDDLFADEAGEDPWREITDLIRRVAEQVEVAVPEMFESATLPAQISLQPTPRSDDDVDGGKAIVCSAVLGLFPTSNQGLLRDVREMVAGGVADGPIDNFVRLGTTFEKPHDAAAVDASADVPTVIVKRVFRDERLISQSDPCQTRAVRMARTSRGLVVHGPPGTGKSQTIANIIGDHLAHGERVLFVCDKRTALDVVADRLNALGVGSLLATVHDAQRDQREFYRSVREQLDNLVDTPRPTGAAAKLGKIDEELQALHDELTHYYRDLMGDGGDAKSFHYLVGQWLAECGPAAVGLDERSLQQIPAADFDRYAQRLKELLSRGAKVAYADNPWTASAGVTLAAYLQESVSVHASAIEACLSAARRADAAADPPAPPFEPSADLEVEAAQRRALAVTLRAAPPFPPESVRRWSGESADALATAVNGLARIQADMSSFVTIPDDEELRTLANAMPADDAMAMDRQALTTYANEFRRRAALYAAAERAAGEDSGPVILRWMAADATKAASARKRLDAADPLAAAVGASTLDASLLARLTATPLPANTLTEWLSALNTYLDVAERWTAVFQSAKKKAAEPAVRHFGLSLNPASARQVKQFLVDLQQRHDLRAALAAATSDAFDEQPDDAELLAAFRRHHETLNALLAKQPTATVDQAVRAETAIALNGLIGPAFETVRSSFARYNLPADAVAADRLAAFDAALRLRLNSATALRRYVPGETKAWPLPSDKAMVDSLQIHQDLIRLLSDPAPGTLLGGIVRRVLHGGSDREATLVALEQSGNRAAMIRAFENAVSAAGLLAANIVSSLSEAIRQNRPVTAPIATFAGSLDSLEGVLRVGEGLRRLPESLSAPAKALLDHRCNPSDGYAVVRRNVLAGEIARRLRQNPQLQAIDGHRLQASFDRFRQLSERKKELVRDDVVEQWTARQKARLLASTGSRLNGLGTGLRIRMTLRGERAMRLRQVIAHGRSVEGGDPLFDLRPVWMASPETVAQLFAREPIFDVIVFDEASQCRLEEALPVLTRGKRLVIAGDPKQLPPTRFFESAVATSADDDAETDQELFEQHQGEVEDLLAAALTLDGMAESYLNVHYRSKNADLIGFSNEYFYGSRLQAIPGHPKNRIRYAPITLYRAEGTYEKRRNLAEAEQVCRIVHDLLRRAEPPSIGIACFNTVQRDLIVESLEAWAEKDADFASKLAAARERRGHGSSEGLFVKNLENVQGDERDHLIISTTYGPDKNGKFRRSFGPLGMSGGGRRLNVLVTRARAELHIVTSIPRSVYASLPDVPPGAQPGGAWLLFAYLNYAEKLKDDYETMYRILEDSGGARPASVYARPSKSPSAFAKALGHRLAATANASSEVHWGNEGFTVDLAVMDPRRADDVLFGVQCDMTRFAGSDDPVEWDAFQTMVHESQGWKLCRLWTPHFYRDPDGGLQILRSMMDAEMKGLEADPSSATD